MIQWFHVRGVWLFYVFLRMYVFFFFQEIG